MDISELQHLVETHPNISAANKLLGEVKNLSIKGLHGSSRALFSAALYNRLPKTYLYLLNDLETAGYFYHDLTQIYDSKDILFFPSAFKRAAKYGQIDSANEILRTETLSRLQGGNDPIIIVSYPDAIAEKTVSKQTLQENTLHLSAGEKVDSAFVADVLDSYGFSYVDYVYEPRQYATRGSILDVFSYSGEYPFRIDFFGDEVETIRSFDVESQLSKERFNEIRIVPEFGKSKSKNASLFDSLPQDTIIAIDDMRWVESRVESVYADELHINTQDESFVQADLLSKPEFLDTVKRFRHIRFDNVSNEVFDATLQFQTSA